MGARLDPVAPQDVEDAPDLGGDLEVGEALHAHAVHEGRHLPGEAAIVGELAREVELLLDGSAEGPDGALEGHEPQARHGPLERAGDEEQDRAVELHLLDDVGSTLR